MSSPRAAGCCRSKVAQNQAAGPAAIAGPPACAKQGHQYCSSISEASSLGSCWAALQAQCCLCWGEPQMCELSKALLYTLCRPAEQVGAAAQ